jgi:hypothetical protein
MVILPKIHERIGIITPKKDTKPKKEKKFLVKLVVINLESNPE